MTPDDIRESLRGVRTAREGEPREFWFYTGLPLDDLLGLSNDELDVLWVRFVIEKKEV